MKKKILLFVTVLALSACFFALAVSASDIYSDFTQNGANGEAPLFYLRGYAVSEAGGSICVEYDVNVEAIKAYEGVVGKKLEFGVVVARAGNLIDGKPLDANGDVVGTDPGKVQKADLSNLENPLITLIIHGLDETMYDEKLVMALYVMDDSGVRYITDDTSTDVPCDVSYNSILNEVEPPVVEEPEKPRVTEVTVDGFTYAIDGVTAPAADRIKQMNKSNADYKSGSSESTSMYSFAARLIASGGSALGMPDAAKFMSHYLGNTGNDYTIDVGSMLSGDSGALSSRNVAINRMLRAAEQLAVEGESLTVGQLTEGHPMQWELATQNWQYSLGSYFDDVDVTDLTVTEVDGVKTYTANIKYIVTDFYNWDTNDYNKFKDIISPHQLHELHKAGKAKEFLSYGEITYANITWTEGQTVDQIAGLN